MYYELNSTPITPVSLEDAKAYLRVDTSADDDLITDMVLAAVEWGEAHTNRDFRSKDWILYTDDLCNSQFEKYPFISLRKSPLASLDSVSVSEDGSYSSFDDYLLKQHNDFSRLLFTNSTVIDDDAAYTYKIEFTSGYSSLPSAIKKAILQHVAFMYENRGDASVVGGEITPPQQVVMTYRPYKILSGYA